jgi:hypothetical protein
MSKAILPVTSCNGILTAVVREKSANDFFQFHEKAKLAKPPIDIPSIEF